MAGGGGQGILRSEITLFQLIRHNGREGIACLRAKIRGDVEIQYEQPNSERLLL
jgi:hypothetical protein